jgi:hypothetical protein
MIPSLRIRPRIKKYAAAAMPMAIEKRALPVPGSI